MNITRGTYTGTGAGQSITGVGFQPKFLIVKRLNGEDPVSRSDVSAGTNSYIWNDVSAPISNGITSLDTDGFTVGANILVSENTIPYHYIAFASDADAIATGTYTGNGGSQTVSGLGLTPIQVFTFKRDGAAPQFGVTTNPTAGDLSWAWGAGGAPQTGRITAMAAGSFTVSSQSRVNENLQVFEYLAFADVSNTTRGSFTGNGGTAGGGGGTAGFEPVLVFCHPDAAGPASVSCFRSSTQTGTNSWNFAGNQVATGIDSFTATAFTTADNGLLDQDTVLHYWMAFGAGVQPAGPAPPTPVIPPGTPPGGFFEVPATPYGSYKSHLALHDLFNRARLG